jgi:hypothetical protein
MTALHSQINELTLRELSLDAAKLWSQIEEATESGEEGKVEELLQQLVSIQDGIEAKIDAIAWVFDQLNLDLENWEDRKARTVELYDAKLNSNKLSVVSFINMKLG